MLYTFDVRPYLYYFIITFIITIILVEILFFDLSSKRSIIILIQIITVVLNLIWGVTLNYHFFIARTDPLAHTWWITNLLGSAYITDIFIDYKAFPLWHILVSSLYLILDPSFSAQKLMFFTNGIVYSFTVPLAYIISSRILKNERIALISTLFLCIYPDFIFYGMSSIARSVMTFLMLMLILFLLRPVNQSQIILTLLMIPTLIIYHHASMPFIITILLIIWTLQYVFITKPEDRFVKLHLLMLIAIATLGYWMYKSVDIFQMVTNNIKIEAPGGTLTQSIVETPVNEVFNYLQFTPLLLFVILGCIWALEYKEIDILGKIFCLIGLLLTAVTFPGPALLINKVARNFSFERFGEYTMFFIAVSGAVGFYLLYMRSEKLLKGLIIILFAMMCFLSISNDFTASDNPLVKRPFYTYYLTEEETIAFDHVANITSGFVMSDYVTTTYIIYSTDSAKSHILEIDRKNSHFLRNKPEDVILIREGEFAKRPLKLYSSSTEEFILDPSWDNQIKYYYTDVPVWSTVDSYNMVFYSGNVLAIT